MSEKLITHYSEIGRRPDILHEPGYDLVVNREVSGDDSRIGVLLDAIHAGFPSNWIRMRNRVDTLLDSYTEAIDNPSFFAKKRHVVTAEKIREMRTHPEKWESETLFPKEVTHAFSNVMNEIRLAPLVTRVLNSEEAQCIAQKYGYESLQYVEPLAGLIERTTGNKYTFYDYMGEDNYEQRLDKLYQRLVISYEDQKQQARDVTKHYNDGDYLSDELIRLFEKYYIWPADLKKRQFLYPSTEPSNKKLYLIDTEGYILQTPKKENGV